jgi:hypothetical protein
MKAPSLATVCLALLAAPAAAQDSKPQDSRQSQSRLQGLLQELHGLDPKAWEERIKALEEQAKSHDARAAELRAQAGKLQQQAVDSESTAKGVRAEIERLAALRKLLGSASQPKAEAKPDAKPDAKPEAKAEAKPASMLPASRPGEPANAGAKPSAAKPPDAKPDAKQPDAKAKAGGMPAGELVTWDRVVARILEDNCSSCHDASDKKGGLDVSSFAAIRQGGGSGRTIVPGDPEQSRLYRMIARQERPFMPKDADPLADGDVAKIKAWIEQGASEDAEGARAFLAAKDAAGKDGAAKAPDAAAAAGAPMPADLPPVQVHSAVRPQTVRCLARSPHAPLLAMPGLQQVLLFDAQLRPLGVLPCPLEHVESVAFAADGAVLVAAGGERGRLGQAVLYDVRTGERRGTFGNERDAVLAAAVHPARGLVALGGPAKVARVIATADGKELFAGKHDDFVLALEFSPDGKLLAAGDRAGTIQLWETKGGRIGQTLLGHRGAVNALTFTRGGKQLASVGEDGTLRMWDVDSGKEQGRQQAHTGEALAVAAGPGDALATVGSEGTIKVWAGGSRLVATSPGIGEWLYSVAFGADADTVYVGDWQGRVHCFDVKQKQLRQAR